jgi:hypothetical protein
VQSGPTSALQVSVCGVVERFGAPAVASPYIRAPTDERLGEVSSVRGGRDVQSRVARVDLVMDRRNKIRARIFAARSDTNRTGRERRRRVEPSSDVCVIS